MSDMFYTLCEYNKETIKTKKGCQDYGAYKYQVLTQNSYPSKTESD